MRAVGACDCAGPGGGPRRGACRGSAQVPVCAGPGPGARRAYPSAFRPRGDTRLTGIRRHAVLRIVTDTYVRLWRRVHMDLVRYAGCVCHPSC
ncbi:putative leader peptide [Streptomyces sp. NPDC017249]|uniref:putative leader peptide n=1 Tax=unclassified Streptomyces TaxID=2593676 RepID=UPI003799EF02